jgi:hypothetical protein
MPPRLAAETRPATLDWHTVERMKEKCVMQDERKAQQLTRSRHGLRNLARLIGLALLIASVVRELRLPKEERTWHGEVFGKVPYDLRPPTFARLKAATWNPQNSHVLVPTALGVGWTVNLAALRARLPGASAA